MSFAWMALCARVCSTTFWLKIADPGFRKRKAPSGLLVGFSVSISLLNRLKFVLTLLADCSAASFAAQATHRCFTRLGRPCPTGERVSCRNSSC